MSAAAVMTESGKPLQIVDLELEGPVTDVRFLYRLMLKGEKPV